MSLPSDDAPPAWLFLRLCRFRFLCGEAFSHGVPFEREFVGIVHQAIENGVCQCGIADGLMPMRNRKLAGDNRRTSAVPVFEQLEHVMPTFVAKLREPQSSRMMRSVLAKAAMTLAYRPSPFAMGISWRSLGRRK